MNHLIEYLIEGINSPLIYKIIFIPAVIFFMLKESIKIFERISNIKEKNYSFAKKMLNCASLSAETNEFLREYLECCAFKRCYGISVDSVTRNALIKFQKKYQHRLSWMQIRRAHIYIRLCGQTIDVRLRWYDHVLRWIVTIWCWAAGFYAALIIFIVIFGGNHLNTQQFFILIVAALALFMVALLSSSQNWPYHSARSIIKLTEKSEPNPCHSKLKP